MAIVFVNQPLRFHANARPAAKAFLAAHRQGKAWEMHDKLFENQHRAVAAPTSRSTPSELGLNLPSFKKDIDDPALEKMVADDQALAGSVGADGTPTFFINGRELVGRAAVAGFHGDHRRRDQEGRRAAQDGHRRRISTRS